MKPSGLACAIWILGLVCLPGAPLAQSAAPSMTQATPLPPTIPIFPLQDVMLFPNMARPLHIFEPRYRAMVADALKGDGIIGMVMLRPGYEAEYEGRPPIYPIGCAGIITGAERLADGRYNIVLHGVVKFRVTGEDQSRAYRLAQVEAIPETLDDAGREALNGQRARLTAALAASAGKAAEPPPATLTDEDLVNVLAQYLDIEPTERQDLLEREGPLARARALIDLLELMVKLPR